MEKEGKFYRDFFALAAVLMLQNVVTISVNLADNVMLGNYGEMALAGAAAVNQIQFVLQQLLTAAGEGIVVLGSQYWGAGAHTPIRRICATAFRAAMVIAAVFFAAASFFPGRLLSFFTDNPEIAAEGMAYLSIIRWSYLFFAVTMIFQAAMRCAEMVKISLCLAVMTLFVNCGINYVLIFGHFGAPRMGIRGAAIGTLSARILETIVILAYAANRRHPFVLRLRDLRREEPLLRRDYYSKTVMMMLVQGLWGLNNAVQVMILGHISDSALAASSVASTLFMVLKSVAVGAASASAVLIAKTVGAGREDLAGVYAGRLQRIFIGIGLVTGTVLFFLRSPVLGLYSLSGPTLRLADTFLIIQSAVCVFMSYQMPCNNGIIRGGGSPEFVVRLDLISIWGIVIPCSLLLAFVFKAPAPAVFFSLSADQFFKCIPVWFKVNRGTWIRKLTREEMKG